MRIRTLLLLCLALLAPVAPVAPAAAAPSCTASAAAPPLLSGGCTGIRPGAAMTSPSGCTMNFVFRNGANGSDRYIGTAAHCVDRVGQRVSMANVGSMGSVVWSGWHESTTLPSIDFALVKVDASKLSQVNPAMCHWGGPVSMFPNPPAFPASVPLVHYGHGLVTGSANQTKARRGLGYSWVERHLYFVGAVAWGDSGSPIMSEDGKAAGVIVQITAFDNLATRIDDGIARAKLATGIDFQLVTAPLT